MERDDHTRFAKRVTASDEKQKLAVPTEFVKRNGLVNAPQLQVIAFGPGHQDRYAFELSIRGTGPYMKPVFQARGWRQFVRQNDVRAGDIVHFWMLDANQGFGIQVERDFAGRFNSSGKYEIPA